MKGINLILLSCITIMGCSEDTLVTVPIDKEPPPVVVVQPKMVELKISPEGEVLPFGQKMTLNWQSKDAEYCLLNGEKVDAIGSLETGQTFKDAQISITAVKGTLSSEPITLTKKVGDWKSSKLGLLTYNHPWQMDAMQMFEDGIMTWDGHLQEEQKNIKCYFSLDGELKGYDPLGKLVVGAKFYLLENDTKIKIGSETYDILKLTETQFHRSIVAIYDGKPATTVFSYSRH